MSATEKKLDQLISMAKSLPWTNKDFYSHYVAQIVYLTTYSVKMLGGAIMYTDRPEYQRHLIQNIREEVGHDKVAMSDLKALGHDIANFPQFGNTRALWQSQLFQIERNPDALLGYIYALEYAAVDVYGSILPKITEAYGANAVKFMRLHAEEDQEHVVNARKQLDSLSPASREAAFINMDLTCDLMARLMDDVMKAAGVGRTESLNNKFQKSA